MIIGIDGNEANVEKKVGVSVYTLELLSKFASMSPLDLKCKIFLRSARRQELPAESDFFKYEVVSGSFFWSQIFLPARLMLKRGINVFFSPAHYVPRFCPVPSVVTIHDVSYMYYPEEFLAKDLYQLKNWTAYSLKKARRIIAVSNKTKDDILRNYPKISSEKITVVYNGFKPRENLAAPSQSIFDTYKIQDQKYILYVGTLQPRKNVPTLIEAFTSILSYKPDLKLVLVGKKGWLYTDIFAKAKELNLEDKVVFAGYASDEMVAELYKHATVFVLPSLYEGFGIPVLEAMSASCPVVASNSSSLPEVGGDACLYFDPKSPQDLADKVISLLENKKLKDELVQKGSKRVQLFSWDKCAKETLDVIKSAVIR